MSNKKLSLAIAINLLTENFKKGKDNIISGFKSMQVRVATFVAALGFAGIGLTNFVSKMIQVAKETSRVTTALKNVSGSTAQYIQNQKWVNKLSAEYGLEINALTGNYASFTASATSANMKLEDQRKIFESITRASSAFALDAQSTNGVFLALSQMMSKGKIASQELRLQMGEKLPIALQAMANSMNVSIAQLDKLMAKGELMSKDVLPKFAEELNKLTPNINTDNLDASLNKMENAFGQITDNLDVAGKYKKIIDTVTFGMNTIANNIKILMGGAILGLVFISVHTISNILRGWDAMAMSKLDTTKKLHSKLLAAEAKTAAEQAKVDKLKLQYAATIGKEKEKIAQKVYIAEKSFGQAVYAEEKARLAYSQAAGTKKVSIATRSINAIKVGFAKLALSLKALWATFAPAIIITAITAVIMYFKNIYDETKRIKNIFSEYKKELETTSSTSEIIKLQTTLSLYNKATGNLKEQNKYKEELLKLTGKQEIAEKDINKVIAERIKLLENQARVDYLTRKKIDIEDRINTLSRNLKSDFKDRGKSTYNPIKNTKSLSTVFQLMIGQNPVKNDSRYKELVELSKVAKDLTKQIEGLTKDIITSSGEDILGFGGTSEELTKLEEKYKKSLAELNIKLEHKLITEDEYNKAIDDLVKSTFVEAKISKDKAIQSSKLLKDLEAQLNKPLYNSQHVEISKIQEDYNKSAEALNNQLKNNALTEKEYNSKLLDLVNKTAEQIASMSNLTDAQEDYLKSLQDRSSTLKVKKEYMPEQRDSSFDYKKTRAEVLSEELTVAKKNYDELKELASSNLQDFESELTKMMSNIKSLKDAVKLAELTEDVKALNKEIKKGSYSAAKSIMSGADGMVEGIQRINDAMSNPDASGWEKIMSIWNALTSTIDNFMRVVELINNITEATQMLSAAQQSQAATEMAIIPQRMALKEAETTAEISASAAKSTAAQTEAAAKTTAAYAAFPFVGVGLAAATIAAMFALIPKFEKGGIIKGGPTSGDKILARVNAGEMILNQGQQSNLFRMLNGQSQVSSQSVNIGGKVRGSDIYLSLKNYMKSSGKRL